MKKTLLALTLSALYLPATAFAAQPQADDVMVVTANRFAQPLQNVIAPISIITQEQIKETGAKTLTQVLRRLPGVQIANQGGLGQSSELYVRGTSSGDIVVLMNGVRIGSATLGYANFSAIPLAGVQRIEFIRGPRAAVYGSDAIGGVINIITNEKPQENSATVYTGIGSRHFYQMGASAAGYLDSSTWGSVSVHHESTRGYQVQPQSLNPLDHHDDGYRNQYVMASIGHQINDNWQVAMNGYYQTNSVEYANPWGGADQTNNDLYNIAGSVKYHQDKLNSTLTVANNEDSGTSLGQGSMPSTIGTNRTVANWSNLYQWTPSIQLGGGVDWYAEKVKNTSSRYAKDRRTNTAGYVLATYNTEPFQLEGNVRYDDNSAYGDHTTWQLGSGWRFTPELRVTASVGTAFKAPTFNDLYWPKTPYWSGNPNLKPEQSQNYELALEGDYSVIGWRLAAYQNEIKDMIASTGSTVNNIDKARIRGIELSTNFDTGPFSQQISFNYLDPENLSKGDNYGKQLQRRSRESAKWNVGYNYNQWQFDVSYLYQGKRFDDAANKTKLGSYSLVDLSASYAVTDNLTVRAQVGNLLNKKYETAAGYQTPERNYYATVSYQF